MTPKPTTAVQTTASQAASDFEKLLAMDSKTKVEYVPFGGENAIALSIHIIRKYIAVPARGDDGKAIEPDERECLKFIMLCKSRMLNPFEGDAFMLPFFDKHQGRHAWNLITSHQAFLKRAAADPHYDGKQSGILFAVGGEVREAEGDFYPDETDGLKVTLVGGWCRVHRKDWAKPEYQRLKLATYKKPFGLWMSDPAGMICKCAEAAALRAAFPTLLGGMYLREEMERGGDPVVSARPIFTEPEKKPEPAAATATVTEEAAPTVAPETKPEPGAATAYNPLKAIRMMAKQKKVEDQEVLEFLTNIGSIPEGIQSLEQVALEHPEVIKMVDEQLSDITDRILQAKGKK